MSFSKIKVLAKDSALYGISGVISRMITIFLVPIYTRIFHPADYGLLNLINSTFFLVGILVIFALDNAASRWFYDATSIEDKKKPIASWFWFQFVCCVVFALLLLSLISVFAEHVFKVPIEQIWIIWVIACCTLFTNILPNIIWNWYRLNRRPVATLVFTLSQSLLTISLTVLFVIYLKWHLIGVFAALLVSSFIFSIIALVQLKEWLLPKYIDKKVLKEMLHFSLPMVPAALAFWLINSTDAYFILYFRDKTEVGLFSVGATFAAGVALFVGAFQQAWGPFAYSIMHEPDAKKTYANVFLIYGLGSSTLILGVFMFIPELLMVFTAPNYYGAAWVTSILSINIVLGGYIYIASIGASIAKKTTYYATAVFIGAGLTVVLNIFLIPVWGKEGSALATVLAQLVIPVYLIYKSNKIYPIAYKYHQVILVTILSIICGAVVRFIPFPNLLSAVIVKIMVFILFAFLIFRYSKNVVNGFLKKDVYEEI